MEQGEVLLSGRQDLLRDQNGVFAVEGETGRLAERLADQLFEMDAHTR